MAWTDLLFSTMRGSAWPGLISRDPPHKFAKPRISDSVQRAVADGWTDLLFSTMRGSGWPGRNSRDPPHKFN